MKTIWKYPLSGSSYQSIEMPRGAKILDVQNQSGKPCIWALVDTEQPHEIRNFLVYGTGWKIEGTPGKFIGTFQLDGGAYVFHLFDFQGVAEDAFRG